jgi:nitrite reductase/ring-hydroxylating ferredoxin subunit
MSTQDPATAPSGIGPGWFPAIRAADVAAGPVAVRAGTRRYVAFRPEPGGPISVLSARCPHRLVDLAHADVVQGRLRCPYHGWQFDPDGNCAQVPSNGPDAGVPPRADLDRPWRVRELGGVVWVAPVDPSLASDHSEHVSPGDGRDPDQSRSGAGSGLASSRPVRRGAPARGDPDVGPATGSHLAAVPRRRRNPADPPAAGGRHRGVRPGLGSAPDSAGRPAGLSGRRGSAVRRGLAAARAVRITGRGAGRELPGRRALPVRPRRHLRCGRGALRTNRSRW